MSNNKKKVIVIVGTTASGKTTLAVDLAYKFGGEVISADSRQVYKYMDIGTGKDIDEYTLCTENRKQKTDNSKKKKKSAIDNRHSTFAKIPYHLIDVVHPNTEFDLAKFYKKANQAINDISARGKLPIVAGGTGLYAQALVDGYDLSPAKPDKELREKLEKKSAAQLLAQLKKLDSEFAQNLNNSEKNNKRRLIRYIEIRKQITDNRRRRGESLPLGKGEARGGSEFLVIGITWPREVLRERIYKRLIQRLEKEDMIKEVEDLHKKHRVSWKRMEKFGLEYRFIARYLQKKLEYAIMICQLNIAIGQFAKRQLTWLKRWEKQGQKIHWVKTKQETEKLVKIFIK